MYINIPTCILTLPQVKLSHNKAIKTYIDTYIHKLENTCKKTYTHTKHKHRHKNTQTKTHIYIDTNTHEQI